MKISVVVCWLAAVLVLSGCAPGFQDRLKPIDPGFATRPPAPETAPAAAPVDGPPRVRIIKGTAVESMAEARKRLTAQAAAARPRGLATRLRSLVLRGVPVRRIAELLTEAGGINVLATDAVALRPIDILLRDMLLQDALDAICRLNDLWYRQGEGIVTLMSRKEYLQDLALRQTEQTRAFSVRYTNAADMAKVIQAAMGDQVHLAVIENEKIYGHIDPEEKADVGAGATKSGQDLSVTAAEAAAPAAIPRPAAGTKDEDAKQAPDGGDKPTLAILTVFKRNNCIVARSLDGALLNEMAGIITALDTPTSQVLLEVRILQLTLDDDFQSFFEFAHTDSGSSGVTGSYTTGLGVFSGGTLGTTSLDFVLDGAKLDARIALFKKLGRAEIISTPFLMAANNSKVKFFVGQETPLRDDVTTQTVPIGDSGETITTFEVDIKREELGTDVEMTTFINEDGTVTLEIEAEISTPNLNFSTIQVVNEKTGQVLDFPIDGVDKSEIKSILSARSGQSIAIGGIIRETVDTAETKVPVLGDLPLIGAVFRKTGDTKQKTETVIILTPHVIAHPALAGEASDRFLGRKSSHGQIVEGKENIIGD